MSLFKSKLFIQVHSPDSVTDSKPPNDKLFDPTNKGITSGTDSVIATRIKARAANNKENNYAPTTQIHNHITFPPELMRPVSHTTPTSRAIIAITLLPEDRSPGPHLTTPDFCQQYNLDSDIQGLLMKNKFMRTEGLEFVLITHLEAMAMPRGDIASLQFAVKSWSILRN